MTTHRLGSDAGNHIIAQGARTMGEVWTLIYATSTHMPVSKILGDDLGFKVGAKLLLAMFKGINVGRNLATQLSDIIPATGALTQEQFMDWSKAAFSQKSPDMDWFTPTAPTLLNEYLDYFTQLLACTAGSTMANDHAAGCLIMMTTFKAEGKRKIKWSAEMVYKKHAAWMA